MLHSITFRVPDSQLHRIIGNQVHLPRFKEPMPVTIIRTSCGTVFQATTSITESKAVLTVWLHSLNSIGVNEPVINTYCK